MAIYDGFFDAQFNEETGEFDRSYHAEDFVGYFTPIIGSGVCVYENPDSMKVIMENGEALISPGYLFIRGFWLANQAGEGEDPAKYRGYAVSLPADGAFAIVARLSMARRMIDLLAVPNAQGIADGDTLVLAVVDRDNGTVTDTRKDASLCGTVDSAGSLANKVAYVIDYIENQIEGKLQQVEADLNAQSVLLDEKIALVEAEVEKLAPPPVGTVKFSASEDVGPEWLKCDGSFVNEADYPALVEALGKLTPGMEDHEELLEAQTAELVSNLCLYDDTAWIYLVKSRKLVGVSASGRKEIMVTGAEGLQELSSVDTVLSVCGGAVYLAQNNQQQSLFLLLEYAGFTGDETSIEMTSLGIGSKVSGLNISRAVPRVVDVDGKKYMVLGDKDTIADNSKPSRITQVASWAAGEFASAQVTSIDRISNQNVTSYDFDASRKMVTAYDAYSPQNSNEFLFASAMLDARVTSPGWFTILFCVGSLERQVFGIGGMSNAIKLINISNVENIKENIYYQKFVESTATPPLNIIPAAGNGEYLLRAEIKNRKLEITHGRYNPQALFAWDTIEITLPSRARIFKESTIYCDGQGLWFIFVGTGLLFSETLENGAWGYLDTQGMVGVITQFGSLDYNATENALYISGVATGGVPKLVRLQLPDLYDYGNDGAWLPMIASDGVPAWIKAKEPEEPV